MTNKKLVKNAVSLLLQTMPGTAEEEQKEIFSQVQSKQMMPLLLEESPIKEIASQTLPFDLRRSRQHPHRLLLSDVN